MGKWHSRAVCECGHHETCPFGNLIHIHKACCPSCGEPVGAWQVAVMRWIPFSIWWKPKTWLAGRWETKEKPERSPRPPPPKKQ